MADSASRKRGCWLTDHADIPVPPAEEDFVMVGNLVKRRGGFGKMAHQKWKNRCFVLLDTGTLCYFEASSFAAVDFCEPPRGILTLDGEVAVSRPTKQDGDFPGEVALIVQGGGQRWKLSSNKAGELERWEEALKSMIKKPTPLSRTQSGLMRSPTFDSTVKSIATASNTTQALYPTPQHSSTNGSAPRETEAKPTDAMGSAASGDISNNHNVWDVVYSLMAVDAACYLLYTQKVARFDSRRALPLCTAVALGWVNAVVFYATVLLVNFAVVSRMLRRSQSKRRQGGGCGVPIIHEEGVGPLRVALKRRFPPKKDPQPVQMAQMGEVSGGVPSAR